MIIKKAYKTEIAPNNTQEKRLWQHLGAVRHTYNWALAYCKDKYEKEQKSFSFMGKGGSAIFTEHKGKNPWLYEISSTVLIQCLKDLDQAFKNFYRRCKLVKAKKLSPKEAGYPSFKSRYSDKDRGFRFMQDAKVKGSKIYLPKIGWIKFKEDGYVPEDGLRNTTISHKAGKWFVSVQVEEEIPDIQPNNNTIFGVHLGVKNRITSSDGTIIDKFLPYHLVERRLKRLNRELHRRKLGSKNRYKTKEKIAKLNYHVAQIRKDAEHKASTEIVAKGPAIIVIEEWKIKEMMQDNSRVAKMLADTSCYELRRQIEYKANWAGVKVINTPPNFPSSKTCSRCGHVNNKPLSPSQIMFECEECGLIKNREINAAMNLQQYGMQQTTGAQPGSQACGEVEGGPVLSEVVPLCEAGIY
uniref:Putative transposase n=1 Tax=viral metagenome TaxID=1070528 RepID=A0A6M3IWW1_9ZZZZ